MKEIRVAYFALSEEFGARHAGYVHSYNIAKALAANGVDVKLFIRPPKKKIYLRLHKKPEIVPVVLPHKHGLFRHSPLAYIGSFFRMFEKIKDADIIHERFHVNPIDLLFTGKRKYILEVNDPAIALSGGVKKYFISKKFSRCDAIITQTETLKKILQKYTKKKIFVVPNGVDTSLFRPDVKSNIRKEYGIGENELLITFVGAFREWHGVECIPEIAKNIPEAKFLAVGAGPLFAEVCQKSKGIKNVLLAGAVEHSAIPSIMAASDILIAPFNTTEYKQLDNMGFWWCPMKLFEYMAAGKPVVSYNFDEVGKIICGAGLLAEPGNTKNFIAKLKALLRNKALRTTLGKKARETAVKNYGWDMRAKEIIKIYGEIL